MTDLLVEPATRPLVGSVPVPSDKSIGHRALLLAAIATGRSRIRRFSFGEDNVSTMGALRAMGIGIDEVDAELAVVGGGLFGLQAAAGPLDCGNSGTTMRLLAGLLAAQPFATTLVGDASLSRRPMMRVARPLRARGATLEGAAHPSRDDITAPLTVGPLPERTFLRELEHASDVASAQVKSALLLSGLYAHGKTFVHEPHLSRDHTERMMLALGVPLRAVGTVVELDPSGWSGVMPPLDVEIPGDLSAAAFVLAAGLLVPGSRVTVRDAGSNPTRTGFVEIARDMGGRVAVEPRGDMAGEPVGHIHVEYTPLRPARIGGELVPRAVDEIPIACALAARASGTTVIRDAAELRVKESDRIATMAGVLRAFGVTCDELPDGLEISGRAAPLEPAEIDSRGDHRIAMTAAILGLLARGPSVVRDAACVATSFPRFAGTLRALGANVRAV